MRRLVLLEIDDGEQCVTDERCGCCNAAQSSASGCYYCGALDEISVLADDGMVRHTDCLLAERKAAEALALARDVLRHRLLVRKASVRDLRSVNAPDLLRQSEEQLRKLEDCWSLLFGKDEP